MRVPLQGVKFASFGFWRCDLGIVWVLTKSGDIIDLAWTWQNWPVGSRYTLVKFCATMNESSTEAHLFVAGGENRVDERKHGWMSLEISQPKLKPRLKLSADA